MNMKGLLSLIVVAVAVTVFFAPAHSQAVGEEAAKIDAATEILKDIVAIQDNSIPTSLMEKAYAFAVIPNVFDVAVGTQGYSSKGVMVVRTKEGTWSNPAFLTLTGKTLGLERGTQPTDVVLVFMTKRSIDAISKGKIKSGTDLAVAAGPVGRELETGGDIEREVDVLSYTHSRGLFAGIALEGDSLQFDSKANADFYEKENITPSVIFAERGIIVPVAAGKFKCALAKLTNTEQACT
jgi:lipid-binding SYLF domain-containing protein